MECFLVCTFRSSGVSEYFQQSYMLAAVYSASSLLNHNFIFFLFICRVFLIDRFPKIAQLNNVIEVEGERISKNGEYPKTAKKQPVAYIGLLTAAYSGLNSAFAQTQSAHTII